MNKNFSGQQLKNWQKSKNEDKDFFKDLNPDKVGFLGIDTNTIDLNPDNYNDYMTNKFGKGKKDSSFHKA